MMNKRRRLLMRAAAIAPAGGLLSGCAGDLERFPSWRYAREAVLELRFTSRALQGSPWNLSQMLQHAAQSIEFSVKGFPALKSGWFRGTVGAAAFAVFDARGKMSHSLDEPIPGAPALDAAQTDKTSVQRLLDAMDVFSAHKGEFFPHFAYGKLDRESYERAHLMHLANHWQQLTPVKKI